MEENIFFKLLARNILTLTAGFGFEVFTQAVAGGPQDHTASDPIICNNGGQMIGIILLF